MIEIHKETSFYCFITILGNILPTLISLLAYTAGNHAWEGWKIFYGQGEFYLYSASLLTTACYTFYSYKIRNTDINSLLFFLSIALIFAVSILYAMKIAGMEIKIEVLKLSSFFLFLITVVLYYYSAFTHNTKIDVVGAQKKAIQEILDQL